MLSISHLDTCYPDFFQGSTNPVLAVSVWHGMTYLDLYNAVMDDFRVTPHTELDDVTTAQFIAGLVDCFHHIVNHDLWNDTFFTLDPSELDENDEPLNEDFYVVAYFSVELTDNLESQN